MLDFLFPFHIFLKKMALELTMDDCHLSDIKKIGIKKFIIKKLLKEKNHWNFLWMIATWAASPIAKKKKRNKKVSMDDRHFGYRPKTLKNPGATEAALAEHSFRRRHLRRVRSFGGFGETHGSRAHTYARASGLADLSGKLTHVGNICVYMCVGLWSVWSGVVAPGCRGVAVTAIMMMMPWRSRERPKSFAGSKEVKKLNDKRKNPKSRKRRPWNVRMPSGCTPRSGRQALTLDACLKLITFGGRLLM